MKRRPTTVRGWLCLTILLMGCHHEHEQSTSPPLTSLPIPTDLDALDPPVRDQYEERRNKLEELLETSSSSEDLSQAYGALAMWHHAYGDYPLARLAYEHALAQRPTPPWLYYLGRVHGALGETDAARRRLQGFLAEQPEDVPARVHLAEIELEAGRPEASRILFEEALDRQPDTPRALAGRGRLALQERDYELAVRHLRRALELQPDRSKVAYSLGLAYRGLGEARLAADHMARGAVDNRDKRDASMEDPLMGRIHVLEQGVRVHGQRGRRAFVEGEFEEAIEAARQAVAANPEAVQPQLNLGAALLRAGRPAEAIVALEEVLQRSPGHPIAHFNLAATYYQLDRHDQAEVNYRAAVTGNPGFKEAHFNLANLLRLRGEPRQALTHYEAVIRLDPGLTLARIWRAVCLSQLQRSSEALRLLEEDLREQPGNPLLQLAYARLLSTADDAAVRHGGKALELSMSLFRGRPQVAEAEAVASAHAELGQFSQAVAWQTAALEAAREEAPGRALARISRRLDLYRRDQPGRQLWNIDELKGARIPVPPPTDD